MAKGQETRTSLLRADDGMTQQWIIILSRVDECREGLPQHTASAACTQDLLSDFYPKTNLVMMGQRCCVGPYINQSTNYILWLLSIFIWSILNERKNPGISWNIPKLNPKSPGILSIWLSRDQKVSGWIKSKNPRTKATRKFWNFGIAI